MYMHSQTKYGGEVADSGKPRMEPDRLKKGVRMPDREDKGCADFNRAKGSCWEMYIGATYRFTRITSRCELSVVMHYRFKWIVLTTITAINRWGELRVRINYLSTIITDRDTYTCTCTCNCVHLLVNVHIHVYVRLSFESVCVCVCVYILRFEFQRPLNICHAQASNKWFIKCILCVSIANCPQIFYEVPAACR